MSSMIQIRNVPEEIHREMKSRAALAGMSLSDYLLSEIKKIAARPSLADVLARLRALPPVELEEAAADILRAERDRR